MNNNNLTDAIIEAIQDKKGSALCHINLRKVTSAPSYEFIIAQGKTPTQTSAIADNIIDKTIERCARKPVKVDGMRNGQWIILDYGEIMVHLFVPEFREFYNLEDLWSDGEITNIPDLD